LRTKVTRSARGLGRSFALVGRDEAWALRARAHELAIGDNVMFLDSRSDVPEILMASDIGILYSYQE
jgi:hypothetical protein